MRFVTGLSAAALALAAVPAAAAVDVHTDFASFAAAAGPLILNDLDSAPHTGAPFTVDFGDFTLEITGFDNIQPALDGSGMSIIAFGLPSTVAFTFDNPIAAFGLKVFDLGDGPAPVDLVFTVDGVDHTIYSQVQGAGGALRYAGVVDAAGFTSIVITSTGISDFAELDDVSYSASAAVPEPSAWAVMLLGFGALGAALRRRRLRAA